jgi:multicomponent Na+:H+ antiporter subunit E
MAVLFFAFWVILNGKITWEIVIFGVVITALLYWFCVKFLDYSPKKELRMLRIIPKGIGYFFTLLKEIVKSNLALLPFLYTKRKPEPELVSFHTPLKQAGSRSILANSITVTPGTITVLMKEDGELVIHCLDRSLAEDIDTLDFQKKLLAMEEVLEEEKKQ